MGIELLRPGTFWWYRDRQYVIHYVDEKLLSQDLMGDWVPTVVYSLPHDRELRFGRAITDFSSKFGTKSV